MDVKNYLNIYCAGMLKCKLDSTNGGTFSNSAEQVILIFFSFSEGLSYVKVGPGIQNFNNISSRNVKNLLSIKDHFVGGWFPCTLPFRWTQVQQKGPGQTPKPLFWFLFPISEKVDV